jgi:glycine betaine/choline ABC-type transport system substrate-binding protein
MDGMSDTGHVLDTREHETEPGGSRRAYLSTLTASAVLGLAGCLGGEDDSRESTTDDQPELEVVVGSKNYTEQIVLGALGYVVLVENTDHSLINETGYGSNEELWPAVERGDIDVYFEYMGSMWTVHPPQNEEPIFDEQEQYDRLKEQVEREHELHILDRTSWENTWVLYGNKEAMTERGIGTITGLAAYVNDGNYDVTVVLEAKFYDRPDGWPQLTAHYGFEDDALQQWEANDGIVLVDTGLTYDKFMADTGDVGLGYSTNAQMATLDVTILEDDKNFWPFYNVVPVVHDDVATDQVFTEINKIPDAIEDAETMQELNAQVDINGDDPLDVARSFLAEQDVI